MQRVAIWVLGVILIINSASNIIAARQATTAVKNTDLIKQCTTPGTRCSKLTAENRDAQNKFFTDLITKANRCLLESAFQSGLPVTGAARIASYDSCISR